LSTDAAPFTFEPLHSVELRAGAGGRGLGLSLADIENVHEEARAAGEAEGRAEGLLAAHADVDSALAALSRAATEVGALRAQMAAELEREAVEFALSLAEQILAGTLDVQPDRVLDGVRGAGRHRAV
jgi:flagellar assembly protein FliH